MFNVRSVQKGTEYLPYMKHEPVVESIYIVEYSTESMLSSRSRYGIYSHNEIRAEVGDGGGEFWEAGMWRNIGGEMIFF